jgi:hypothetical protein
MKKHTANNQKKKHKIDAIEVTSDCLTSRAGLALCVAYMNQRLFVVSSGIDDIAYW